MPQYISSIQRKNIAKIQSRRTFIVMTFVLNIHIEHLLSHLNTRKRSWTFCNNKFIHVLIFFLIK